MAVDQVFQSHARSTGELVEVYQNRGIQFSNHETGVNVLLSFIPVLLDHGLGFKLEIHNNHRFWDKPTVRYIVGATMGELGEIMDRLENSVQSQFGHYELGGYTFGKAVDSWIEGVQDPVLSKVIQYGRTVGEEEPKYSLHHSLKFDDVDPEEETVFIGKQLKFGENDDEF